MIDMIRKLIKEDVGFEDITTNALIEAGLEAEAEIISRDDGIIAGVEVAEITCDDFNLDFKPYKLDGDKIRENEIILSIKGNARHILLIERTLLNIMMRMSGIATTTYKLVQKARRYNPNVIIAGTRKTTPGLQWWEKQAIRIGGGDTHRFRLDDCAMIKDNHVSLIGDLEEAIKKVKSYISFTKKIEVEVESVEDAILAARCGADIILLDNMGPSLIKDVIKALERENLRDNVILEASGGIKPDNIDEYAATGVDAISMGFITHSTPVIDLSLEISKI
ncbi:MAG: carboxylating nicotinate-nucleotide diphosphorylase [Methanobacteriaceae archaeon]|nr:carboxylating nicotinate-nucleotide diphosphorylase [Methanobacteriaceae archaeon]